MISTPICIILIVVIASFGSQAYEVYSVNGGCPDDVNSTHICNCASGILDCTCGPSDHLVISRFNDTEILGVRIEGCDKLTIQPLAFKNLSFEFVYFGKLNSLVVYRLAFFSTFIEVMEISDVANFFPKRFAFSGVDNVTSVNFRNVSASTIPRYFIMDVNELTISDCNLGIVQARAFVMIQNVDIRNCTVDFVQKSGFFLHNKGGVFLFLKNTVASMNTEALHFGPWDNVTICENDLEELQSHFLDGNRLQHFNFSRNNIEVIASYAFRLAYAIESMDFSRNRFTLAEPFSIPELHGLPEETTIGGNQFSCDCELSWLWQNSTEEEHDDFMNNNFCIDFEKNVSLADIQPVYRKDGVCIEMVSVSTTTTTSTTPSSTAETSARSTDIVITSSVKPNHKSKLNINYAKRQDTLNVLILFCSLLWALVK